MHELGQHQLQEGLELNDAAVETTPYDIVVSGTSLLARPTTTVSTTIFSGQKFPVACCAMHNVVYTVGDAVYDLTEKDLVIANSGGICFFN